MSGDDNTDIIEFNSMAHILNRLDKITNFINYNRSKGNYRVMHGYLIDYFKEIVADLTETEMKKAWDDLLSVKKYLNLNTDLPINPKASQMLDEIDINLRLLAKAHGYLTKNTQSLKSRLIS